MAEELPGGVCLDVLGPSRYLAAKGPGGTHRSAPRIRSNSISVVISIAVAGRRLALLPGDLDGVGLRDLMENCKDLRAPILIYPHHGGLSGGMNPIEFTNTLLSAVHPKLVVFSIGRGHHATPNPDTVRVLRETLPMLASSARSYRALLQAATEPISDPLVPILCARGALVGPAVVGPSWSHWTTLLPSSRSRIPMPNSFTFRSRRHSALQFGTCLDRDGDHQSQAYCCAGLRA